MSFGPSNTTKAAENNLAGTSNLALNSQLPMLNKQGGNLLNLGMGTTQPGVNFFNTVAGGNQANTAQALAPNIDQIRQANSNNLTAINTLMPRGGGRAGAMYEQSYAPTSGILNLFNSYRPQAAMALPQIGLQEAGLGTNLFGLGVNTLEAATGANTALGNMAQRDTQRSDSLWGGIGSGLTSLALAPVTSGGSLLGKLFKF